jgi:hypothetical protein
MFNASKIKTNLYGVVGFRQPFNPTYAILDTDNSTSVSDQWVSENPHCKIEHLYDTQDYSGLSDAEFNVVLKNLQEDAIVSVCSRVFNKPDYIDRQVLYKNAQNKINTETLPDGFVCFKIAVSNKKNVAFRIERVLLDFEGTGDIELLLFNTSQSTPINSKVITITSTNQSEVLNWAVDNSGDTYKGEYYLGYLTSYAGIGTLKPFKRDYENSDLMSYVSELYIDKYYFSGHATNTLPNLDNEDGMDQAIGVNPDITVYDDYTDLIIQNKFLFATAVKLAVQVKCIEIYLASLRSNLNERESKMQSARLIELLEGTNNNLSVLKVTGLMPTLLGEVNHVRNEINKLIHGYFGERAMIDTLI